MKNVVKLDNYYRPEELKKAIEEFVNYYNHQRYHESIQNLKPVDVYFGKADRILKQRQKTKALTLQERRRNYEKRKLLKTFN